MGRAALSQRKRKPFCASLARAKAYLEPEEVDCLEKAAASLRDRLLIRLLFHLGCRISEAVALTVPDIDLQQGMVTIQHLKGRLTQCQLPYQPWFSRKNPSPGRC